MFPPPPPPSRADSHSRRDGAQYNIDSSSSSSTSGRRSDPSSSTRSGETESSIVPISDEGAFCQPVRVERGLFGGRWMRFSLSVAQEPVIGRRKSEKDRRPLGPCPIIRFRAIECRRRGGGSTRGPPTDEWDEQEVDPSAIEPTHLICSAQIRPPIPNEAGPSSRSQGSASNLRSGDSASDQDGDIGMEMREDGLTAEELPDGDAELPDGSDGPGPSSARYRASLSQSAARPTSSLTPNSDASGTLPSRDANDGYNSPSASRPPMRSASESETVPSRTGSASTSGRREPRSLDGGRNLYGSLHVPAVRVPTMEGGMGTWHLFTDLSVRQEGSYSLRFQCFDITAVEVLGATPATALIECHSQAFRVYSPRQVPPLPKPTPLAEHFAQQGFKLNTRKNERTESSPPPVDADEDPLRRPEPSDRAERSERSDIRFIQPSEDAVPSGTSFKAISPAP